MLPPRSPSLLFTERETKSGHCTLHERVTVTHEKESNGEGVKIVFGIHTYTDTHTAYE